MLALLGMLPQPAEPVPAPAAVAGEVPEPAPAAVPAEVPAPAPAAATTELAKTLEPASLATSVISKTESSTVAASVTSKTESSTPAATVISKTESATVAASATIKTGETNASSGQKSGKVTDLKGQERNKSMETAKPAAQVAANKTRSITAPPGAIAPKVATATAPRESQIATASATQPGKADSNPKNGKSKADCAGGNSVQAGLGSACPNNEFKGRATDEMVARFRKEADTKLVDAVVPRKGKYDGNQIPEIDIKLEKEILAPYNPQILSTLTAMTPQEELKESFDSTPVAARSAITLDPRRSKASKNYYESMESVNLMSMLTLFFMP
jgi:hypothetical protein